MNLGYLIPPFKSMKRMMIQESPEKMNGQTSIYIDIHQ